MRCFYKRVRLCRTRFCVVKRMVAIFGGRKAGDMGACRFCAGAVGEKRGSVRDVECNDICGAKIVAPVPLRK